MKDIRLTPEEHSAISSAILGGALQSRHDQLTELLRLNRDHPSIANGIEREISALTYAAAAITRSQ